MSWWERFFDALKERVAEIFHIGDIGAEISEMIIPRTMFRIELFGASLPVPDAVVVSWGVIVVLFLLALVFGRSFRPVPRGRQLLTEGLIGILSSLCKSNDLSDEQTDKVVPFVGSVALLITLANISSFVGISPPAKNPGYCFGLSILSVVFVVYIGFRFVGPKGMWKSLSSPVGMVVPFRILDYIIRILSLALRLFGNVFGAYILMEFVRIVLPLGLPGVLGLWFDLADGILQAAIFTYLTVMYVGEILEANHTHIEQAKKRSQAAPSH
ncbi:MAG: F0F1 ATP synthase subunit A [Clostridiaceae bacterium]|nr:F0F1 ATP synthase subunit A [Clostridiaceae bacterium]